MNYTVLGSQIPHLSKETHKKASMTVHLTPLLLPESTEIRHPAPLLEGGGGGGGLGEGWERVVVVKVVVKAGGWGFT